jgi:metal-sulfur cluster biosynthetic enzyme
MSENTKNPNHPVWKAESTHPELSATLKKHLREVIDPEIGMSVIQLGLIQDVEIEDELTRIDMILTTPFCPYAPAMKDMTKRKAEKALHREADVKIGIKPWDPSMMEEEIEDWGLF